MNTAAQPQTIQGIVAAQINIGSGSLYSMVFPTGNQVGCWAVLRLLRRAMEARRVRVFHSGGGQELNASVLFFTVDDPSTTVEVLKEELGALHLLNFATIGQFEGDKWAVLHPITNRVFDPLAAMQAQNMEALRKGEEAQRIIAEMNRANLFHLTDGDHDEPHA